MPSIDHNALRDRARGALLGLAVGDALGTTLEFKPKDSYQPLTTLVLVHCKGGLGRAGTVAALMLVELGSGPEDAMRAVRRVRKGAIETRAQENYIRAHAARYSDLR